MRMKHIFGIFVLTIVCLSISVAAVSSFESIIDLAKIGHWALLGNWWFVTDGVLRKQSFPKQPESFHSPKAFFGEKNRVLYTRQSEQKTVVLAVYDLSSGSSRDLATLPEEAFAIAASPDTRYVAFVGPYAVLRVLE